MSDMLKKIEEIENLRAEIKQGGGEKAIAKVHAKGKLTARERIDHLYDEGTFVGPRDETFIWRIVEPGIHGFKYRSCSMDPRLHPTGGPRMTSG